MKSFGDFHIDIPLTGGAERFTTCPQCAPTRRKKNAKCLSVNIEKEVWICHHCGWKGSLKQGEQGRPQVHRWQSPVYNRPTYSAPAIPVDQLVAFFEERAITAPTLTRYRISLGTEWMPVAEERVPVIQFPYLRGEEVINIKSRSLIGKEYRQVADAEKILYGLNDIELIDNVTTEAIFVEGECDKLAFAEAGIYHVLSVPDGAPAPNAKPSAKKFEYLENCEKYLEPLTKIILAVDNDEPGKALERELLRRLGPERCWTVVWPDRIKDANQLLIEQGAEALRELIAQARPTPIEHVLRVQDLAGVLMDYYQQGQQRGLTAGWPLLDQFFTVSPGQFTSVTGIPSHGKSEWMDAVMINMISDHGCVFAICSPENRPIEHHLAKLAEKIEGKPFLDGPTERMTEAEVIHSLNWLEPHLYLIDSPEALSVDELLEKLRALVLQKGITHAILDPWNEFDHSRPAHQTETDYISQSISKMKGFGRRHGVHIFCVAHPTKLIRDKNGNYPVPTPYDISGSAHWRNKPDNCITVWRNTQDDTHYSEIHITKIRWKQNGRIGTMALQWDKVCGRYTETALKENQH